MIIKQKQKRRLVKVTALALAVFLFFSPSVLLADTTMVLRPTADGGNDSASWTNTAGTACNDADCYTQVSESSGASCTNSDGETSYVESNTTGAQQTFDVDESSVPDDSTITQIDITVCEKRIGAAPPNKFQTRRCVDGSCTDFGVDVAGAGDYTTITQSHSGLNITKTTVTDLEIGVAITGTNGKIVRVSQISALITFIPPPPPPPTPDTTISIPTSGGGGPSGGVQPTTARFAGQAYPGSKIEVLRKDNIDPQYTNIPLKFYEISPEGVFQVTLSALMQGEYFFALSAKDKDGRTTGTVPFSVNFISANSLVAEDIFLPPTVGLSKTVVSKGSDITVTGYSAPGSEIEVVFDSVNKTAVTSGKNGSYSLATSTTSLKLGEHNVKARQKNKSGRYSDFSLTRVFRISQLASPKADLNGDDKVSIADWSIFLFRWAAKDSKLKQTIDLDGNGAVNIADLSIFLKLIKI